MNSDPERDDLAWRAFCYLQGELTPAEVAAFERRLEESQQAREVLAAEVELCAALATAAGDAPLVRPASPPQSARPDGRRTLTAWTTLAAVIVLLVLARQAWRGETPPRRESGLNVSPELAALWAEHASESAEGFDLAGGDATSGVSEAEPAWETDWADESESADWIMTAVAGMAAQQESH